jgi:hypothetical protein
MQAAPTPDTAVSSLTPIGKCLGNPIAHLQTFLLRLPMIRARGRTARRR